MTDKAAREAFDPAEIEKLIAYMVNRFLGWKLPSNFSPDAGISFKPNYNEHTAHPMKHEPIGTNLFDAAQAEAMVRYMLAGSALCTGYQSAHDAAMAAEPDVQSDDAWVIHATCVDAYFEGKLIRTGFGPEMHSYHAYVVKCVNERAAIALQLQAAQQRDAELRETLQLIVDLAYDRWQQPDGKLMTHVDNAGQRCWIISAGVLDEARAALATQPTSKGETT